MSEQPRDHTSESIAKLRQIYTNPDQLAELESTLAFYQKRESETTNPIVKRFYGICFSLFREDYLNQDMTDGQTRMVVIRSKYRNLFDIISGRYDRFEPQDHQRIKALLDGLIDVEHIHSSSLSINKSVDEAIRSRFVREMYADNLTAVPAHQLFSAMHEYDVVEKWNTAIKYGSVPQKLGLDYQRWSKNKKKFIEECAERHQSRANPMAALEAEAAKAVGDFSDSMKALAGLVGPGSTIGKTFPVIASEQLQAEINKQPSPTTGHNEEPVQKRSVPASERTLKDFYLEKAQTWEQRMIGSENPEVAKVYQRILLGTPSQEITPIIPLSETEKQEFKTNKIASIIKSSVNCFDFMADQDRGEIGAFIIQIMNAISERSAHIAAEFYSVCEPKSLFKAVHMFGFEQSFDRMIDRGFATPHIRHSYQEWKRQGKNKRFIAECAERNRALYGQQEQQISEFDKRNIIGAVPPEKDLSARLLSLMANDSYGNIRQIIKGQRQSFVIRVAALESLYASLETIWTEAPDASEHSETGKAVNKKKSTAWKNFFHAAGNPHILLDPVDRLLIRHTLALILMETNPAYQEEQKKFFTTSITGTAPHEFFRFVFQYGEQYKLSVAMKGTYLPKEFRRLYPNWEKINQAYIEKSRISAARDESFLYMFNKAQTVQTDDERLFYTCSHAVLAKLSGYDESRPLLVPKEVCDTPVWNSLVGTNDPAEFTIQFMRLVSSNWHLAEQADPTDKDNYIYLAMNVLSFVNLGETDLAPIQALSPQEIFSYFEKLALLGKHDSNNLLASTLKLGVFPHVTYEMYETWKNDPVEFEKTLTAEAEATSPADDVSEPISVILEEREMQSAAVIDPLLADPRVTYIDVHHPLVTSGNQTQSMGYAPVDEDRNLETGLNQGDDFQDRTRTLLKVLVGDAKSGVQKITVRWDRRNANDDNVEGRPYNLIDIEMQDGSRSRVAVCDYNGHMTYVERDALEMKDQETLQISVLRANRKVWTAVHVNGKQWCERIQEVLYTPINELTPELKTRSYWHGLKGLLTETFAATVMATGNLPSPTDVRVIEHGPLAERTTYSRMYYAAYNGAVHGIEPKTTYRKLFAQLSSGSMPELAQFINRAPLQAVDILTEWKGIKAELGQEATINDCTDLVKVDGRDHRAIDLAFKFGAVKGLDKIRELEQAMADKTYTPKSLKAFLRLVEQENLMALAA